MAKKKIDDCRPRDQTRLRFYKDKLSPTLESFVSQCLQAPEQDQLNVFEELHIVRDIAGDALLMKRAAESLPPGTAGDQHRVNANLLCVQALREVKDFADTASKIYHAAEDKLSVHVLSDVVQQLKRIVYACFEHDTQALDRFEEMLRTQLHIPRSGADGTLLTPDQDVIAMDECVPMPEPELEIIDGGTLDVEELPAVDMYLVDY